VSVKKISQAQFEAKYFTIVKIKSNDFRLSKIDTKRIDEKFIKLLNFLHFFIVSNFFSLNGFFPLCSIAWQLGHTGVKTIIEFIISSFKSHANNPALSHP